MLSCCGILVMPKRRELPEDEFDDPDWADEGFFRSLDRLEEALGIDHSEYLGDSRIPLYDDQSQQESDYHGDTWRDDL